MSAWGSEGWGWGQEGTPWSGSTWAVGLSFDQMLIFLWAESTGNLLSVLLDSSLQTLL